MARTVLEVVVAGDSRSLERAMGRSSRSVDRFGKDADKGLKKVSVGFKGLGKAAGLAGGALAGGGLVSGIRSVTKAAVESEKSNARMVTQLKASGVSYKRYAGDIERVIQKQSRLAALDDEDLQDSFTNIVRVTKDVNEALKLNALAADIARAKGIDVAKAGALIGKAYLGSATALKRIGVDVETLTPNLDRLKATTKNATKEQIDNAKAVDKQVTAQDALQRAQKAFAGQAEAYGRSGAGANDRFAVAVENLQEKLGGKLTPALASVATVATRFIDQMESGTGAGGKFAGAMGTVGDVVKRVVSTSASMVRGFREGNATMVALGVTAAALVSGFVAFKIVTTVVAAMKALKVAVIAVNIAMRANPFVAVATVVAALGAALVVAYKKSETFRNVVNGVFNAVKKTAGDAISFILRGFDKYLGGLSSMLSAASKIPVIGGKFKGLARTVDEGREKIRKLADGLDGLGEKKVKPRVDTSDIDRAIRRAGGLKEALKTSPLRLTRRPQDTGDIPSGASDPGGKLGGLTAAARGVFGQVARTFGGVRITSGRRSRSQNAAVGGAPNSDHLTGNALDLVPSEGWNPRSIARFDRIASWARGQGLFVGWRGLANHGPGHHLHLSYRGKRGPGGRDIGDPKGKYGLADLKGLAMSVGLGENAASVAAAVGMAESGGSPRAFGKNANGTVDRGLWQINSIHRDSTFGVAGNARAMARISKGGRDFQPWAAYSGPDFRGSDGPWRRFFAAAKRATPKAGRKGGRLSRMGASGLVPLNELEQRKADTLAEIAGYSPTGSDAGGGDFGGSEGAGGAGGFGAAPPAGDPVLDALNAQVALAGLTKDTGDDLSALGGVEGELARRLAAAQAAGDNSAIIDIAGALKGVRDQIEGLRADTQAQTAAMLELTQVALREEQERSRLGQTELGLWKKAIADITNTTLGGKIGLGYQTPGFAGGGARY